MNADRNTHQRVKISMNGRGGESLHAMEPVATTPTEMKRRKKSSWKSILPLPCLRWIVKFLSLRRSSRFVLVLMMASFLALLPPTIYLMSPPSSTIIFSMDDIKIAKPRTETDDKNRSKNNFKNNTLQKTVDVQNLHGIYTVDDDSNGEHEDPFESEASPAMAKDLERFRNRKTFASLQPRVLQLIDPRQLTSVESNSTSLMLLPEEGYKALRSRYVPLRMKDPKPHKAPDTIGDDTCTPVDASWQLAYHPTCNPIHEMSGGWQKLYRMPPNLIAADPEASETIEAIENEASETDDHNREYSRLINYGAFRHVWMIRDTDGVTKRAMKTLRALKTKEKNFDLRNHDRHRRDAMSFETLHGSPLVVDLYASCSNTAIFDYADKGDLLGIFDPDEKEESSISELHLLQIAYNVSLSVDHAHHFQDGHPTMAHTDIKTDQFIYQDGYYKLSDFNRVRFLSWNHKEDKQCGFMVGKNGGEYRSPEEYEYKSETEKVDVFSLGNVLFFLLVREEVWKGKNHKEVYNLVKGGQRPKIPDEIYTSNRIFERTMIRAIEIAWIHDPIQRPSALQVADVIKKGIEDLSKGRKT